MMSRVRIGTRGSKLALYQAALVESRLNEKHASLVTELVKIKTKGDAVHQGGIAEIGRGIFTREIEEALLAGTVDLAVHSAKDLETELPKGLAIGAVLEREDPRDCLVTLRGRKLKDLAPGSKIGTSSLRRRAQLKHLRPDLAVVDLRGNVDTRLKKLEAGECDGMVMAAAGLNRLGLSNLVSEIFHALEFLPQASQGAIAVEFRETDTRMQTLVESINHPASLRLAEAERSFLRTLHGGCQIPAGISSRIENGELHLEGAVFSLDGSKMIRQKISGAETRAVECAIQLANQILDQGGREILNDIRKTFAS